MSDPILPPDSLRGRLQRLVDSPRTQRIVTALILLNAVTLGLETSESAMATAGPLLVLIDRLILTVFVLEILGKLIVYRLAFFRSGWNVFDFLIVGIALVPATENLSVLRALRILRVLRLMSVVPQLRQVVQALLQAIPGMASIIGVLVLVFYVSAVLATKLFGTHPDADMQEWFGTIGASMYTLFQVMTLESWSMGIVRPVMEVYPYAWAFFVPFIMMTTFAVVNLLVGLIVNSMQDAHAEESNKQTSDYRDEVLARLRAIEARLGAETAERAPQQREDTSK